MTELNIYSAGRNAHLSMGLTGLMMLQKQGKLSFQIQVDPQNARKLPYPLILIAEAEGKRIGFDYSDGYDSHLEDAVRQCDLYFKRSFSAEKNQFLATDNRKKMVPLGLHYHVSYPGNVMDKAEGLRGMKEKLWQQVFNGADRSYFTPERFEADNAQNHEGTNILFYCRLWDAAQYKTTDPQYYEQVQEINRERISLVRKLKEDYPEHFTGGIQYSPLAKKLCPELIVNYRETQRTNYLKKLHRSDICIGTTGLHDSIGWKTAEYVAAGKAILCEPLRYEVPGNFEQNRNYLTFSGAEECMKQLGRLLAHPDLIRQLQQNNRQYYEEYLRPDRQMERALVSALGHALWA